MQKVLKNFIALAIFGTLIFVTRVPLKNQYLQLSNQIFPCKNSISYTIGTFDERFGITKEDFLAATKQAEEIWEKPIGKNLFMEKTNGTIKINLIYDYRQLATEKLQILSLSVDDSKSSYESVKARFTALSEQYLKDKTVFTSKVASLKSHQDSYNKEVAYWNDQGGAPEAQFDVLELEMQAIKTEIVSINQLQNSLNTEVKNINVLVGTLNRLARELNLGVAKFNEIGVSRGEEFEEGFYTSGPEGQSIDIYQYDSKSKLIRVLAHEFGHALKLEHIDNSKAIMYRLNQETNEILTVDDLSALKIHCGIK